LAKTTYLIHFSPVLEVAYSKFYGVEFWLTTALIFFKKPIWQKNNIFNFFPPFLEVGYSKFCWG
jgi:hypothetical protein